MLKLMLCLFQENKSYGIKTIIIHPLMYITVHHCTASGTATIICISVRFS